MKNILIITPFFAPYSHAAVYRAHRFAKYLPRFGWKPYVLTVDRSFLYFIDKALLDDLPNDVEIIRARHIDLTYSGFRSLFKETVTNSSLIEGPTSADLTAKLPQAEKKNLIKDIIDKFRDGFIFVPDRYITWYLFALKKAKEIINSKHIDIIYSTAWPLTSHLIGMKLKRQFKIPWVADFRDPGVEEVRAGFHSSWFKYKIACVIEKKIMEEANLILTVCEETRDLFLSKYSSIVNNKIAYIRTGTDIEILKRVALKGKSKKFTIIFVGEFLQRSNRIFFELLKVIFERKLFERNNVEVLIIGSIKRNISLKKEIELLGLSNEVRFIDYLSLEDYLTALLEADATLLPGIPKYTIPIKMPDYLFARKPIIAFDVTNEVQKILKESGLGIFIPNEIENGVEALLNLLRRNYKIDINENYINQFSAFNRTKEFSSILDGLTEK